MVDITESDVDNVYGERTTAITSTKKQNLVSIAERLVDDIYAGQVGHIAIIEGNKEDFAKYVAAHLWEIAEGGETQSQSQTGGSVNYERMRRDFRNALNETRYGRQALQFIREDTSIAIVRTDR